jgi:AraC-like DNA-binding protein
MNTEVEFAKLWNPGLSGIELFSARLFHHAFSKHMHEAYTIGINDGGQGCFTYQGEACCTYPGSFNLLNPGEVHTGQARSDAGWSYRNIYISVPLVEQILAQLEWQNRGLPYFLEPIAWDKSLQLSFSKLFQALSEQNSQLEQQSLMLRVLSQIFGRHTQPHYHLRHVKPETKAIALVRAYLEAHYAENVSIDALAQLVQLSPYYLIRSFKKHVGLPPHGYQRYWQLLQAKRALLNSKPLSEIAAEHGFYDQSHLNRHFKGTFGVTPGQYRQSNSVQDR